MHCDSPAAYVGGTAELIEELCSDPRLETLQVTPDTVVDDITQRD